jgi:hypothetical protein
MANKLYTSAVTQKFVVDFTTKSATANASTAYGRLPKNIVITDAWAVCETELGDADNGDNTTISIGYTSAAAAFYPATSIASMNAGTYLKLIPGVINVGAAEALTPVDTPLKVVALGRVSGNTHSGIVLTTEVELIIAARNDQDIDQCKMHIFI